MTDLITRLSKLDAPDREVDAQIYILFNIPAERAGRIDYSNGMVGWWPKDGPYVSAVTVPAYTASVDEAIALAERVLPFTHLVSTYHDDMACSVKIHCCPEGLSGEWKFDVKGDHEHLAVAYCIAILRAIALLRAKEASNAQ